MTEIARTPAQLGAAFRDRRRALELTQGALAERAGTTQRTVSRIEGGDGGVKLATLLEIAAALGLELSLAPRRKGSAKDIADLF